ncbi:PREDICTED: cyclin-D-binding Myb-like transcription factor 1 isoform X1 [Acropora digitifera]|uniref:cyclin-D-binding Myb-like transcription factor 1 isoform X1 n=1 Tax=Acropora digitifera TaxID=70779 RepID=UPI00077AE941|nr:PREDICTED: cyclin-D-binding Myb-like transcription factor 1 isoform X1 [Acropora digitifera]
MEESTTISQDGLNEVSLQSETACTVDTKTLEESGGDLAFGFSPETQNTSLVELAGGKRKHDEKRDNQVSKHIHLDPESTDGFAELTTLVNMSSTAPLSVSQDVNPHTFSNNSEITTLSQETTTATLNLTAAVAALAAEQLSQESPIIPSQPVVVSDSNNSVNQAWFTTKEDKDNLHGKGVKWRQGMWSKDENERLRENILEYCKVNNIPDPNIIIFEMTKDDRKDFYRTIAKGIRRPLFAIYRRVLRMYDRRNYVGKYSSEEVQQLKSLKEKHGNDWATIGAAMGRSASSVKDRYRLMRDHCHSGKWTTEEEHRLSSAVHELCSTSVDDYITAGISWAAVAEKVGTRSEKQCRSKWLNYLNWKEKGGQEWTKQDEIQLITRIHEMNLQDENEIDWQVMANNWASVRSPQWLRSKWWALKKHVPENEMTSFEDISSFLFHTYIGTLRNKIERQEARFKGNHLPRVSTTPVGKTSHVNPMSTETITNSGISHTITVTSDGRVTRDDHTYPLSSNSQSRFEVVQVNALTAQDLFTNQSTVQGAPSYIIQAPAGQTYIIQQPTGNLVRQTHSEDLTGPSEDLTTGQHDQEVVMTTAVLQAHHAVQTLPEVSPEFSQAIVQTDISGPITELANTELTHTDIGKSVAEAGLQDSEVAQDDTVMDSGTLDSHEDLTADIQMEGSCEKDVPIITQTGPAAIAQTLDGTQLSNSPVVHMRQVTTQNGDIDPLVHVTVISGMETSLASTLSPSSGLTISQHALSENSNSNLSVNAMVPQVTLPDEILQLQSDEPTVLSPTETARVMMVTENSMSVSSPLEHSGNWLSS